MKRSQFEAIIKDLHKKMVILVGPRQVGKTWLAHEIAKEFSHPVYLNYDSLPDRKTILEASWQDKTDLIIFDEIHKMPYWKNHLKGIFDTRLPHQTMLVTGSARLDTFRQSGDSMAGRFFIHRILPFSPAELKPDPRSLDLELQLERGGFPEPLLDDDPQEAKRWRKQYIDGLIREDILDFSAIQDIKAIRQVLEMLRYRVGSPISLSSIATDIQIAPNTVKKYIQILESLFIIFRVLPFSHQIHRSIQKEPKIYFYDTGLVAGDPGIKLENLVAVSLLKYCWGQEDTQARGLVLHTLRTKDGKEIDFCLAEDNRMIQLVEVKRSDDQLSKSLLYFHQKYHVPAIQLVQNLKREWQQNTIQITRAATFLQHL